MSNKNNNNLVAESLKKSMGNLKRIAKDTENKPLNPVPLKIVESSNEKENNENNTPLQENQSLKQKNYNKKEDNQEINQNDNGDNHQPKQQLSTQTDTNNIIVTYNNPMQNLITSYNAIIKRIADDEADILNGFKKRAAQSETHANATIQVRRDIYAIINEYILDSRLGKTKVLNEIFMLGANEFIKKYSNKNKTS